MAKVIGILGGMGPEATCDLYLKIIKCTPATKDQDHIRVVIDSNPKIPDRTAFILGSGEDPRPLLIETAKHVESMGASLIAMPCNTAHYFHGEIQSAVSVPVLHMMKEVARELGGKVKHAGLLATTGTVKTGLYRDALEAAGIETIVPGEEGQNEVMRAIYAIKGGDFGTAGGIMRTQGQELVRKGAEVVIAGCTEIPLVLRNGDLEVPVLDATMVLAQACVREALSE